MGTRDNARCPRCKSLERHRDLVDLMELSGRVLHISPNPGLATYLDKLPVNYNKSFIDSGGYDLENDCGDDWDHVILLHVLEHIENDIDALKNIYKSLNDGGVMWLQVPFEKELREDYGHKTKFTERGLKAKLTRIGFKSEILGGSHKFFKCTK